MAINYLAWQGIELANDQRTIKYAQAGLKPATLAVYDCGCDPDAFATALDGSTYSLPASDPAPWYSASEPLSEDVAGLLIENITGLDRAPLTRQLIDRTGHGSTIGRSRYTARTIVVTGAVIARTTEAAEWYVRWLADQMRDNPCEAGRSCAGHDACFYLSCPELGTGCNPNETEPDTYADRLANDYARTLYRVAAVSEPEIVERISNGVHCPTCPGSYELLRVQFTLVAGDPFAYTDPTEVLDAETLTECDPEPECIEWVIVGEDETCPDPCSEPAPCATDPLCETPPTPPQPPVISDPCACTPMTVSRTCFDIPLADLDATGDNVPVVQVYAGTADVRGLRLIFLPNPIGLDADLLNDCNACFEINLPFLPAGATWTFDAARRTSTIFCPPLSSSKASTSGPDGGPLIWPEFSCPSLDYGLCVEVDCETYNAGITVSLDMIARQA